MFKIPNTLSARLLLSFLLSAFLGLGLVGVMLSMFHSEALKRQFDQRMYQTMRALISRAEITDTNIFYVVDYGDPLYQIPISGAYWQLFRIVDQDGTLSLKLHQFSASTVDTLPVTAADIENVYDFRYSKEIKGPGDQTLRMIFRKVIPEDQNESYVLVLAHNIDALNVEVERYNILLFLILFGASIILGAVLYSVLKWVLHPLNLVESEVQQIERGVAENIRGTYPAEIMPLVNEINNLLSANAKVVKRARTHVGNLAHALKTPLAVLSTTFQRTPLELDKDMVNQQLLQMQNQISHHLQRARIMADAKNISTLTPINKVSERMVVTLRKLNSHIDFDFKPLEQETEVAVEQQDLEEILGNLLDNASKFADSKAALTLQQIECQNSSAVSIEIEDDGPGLTEDQTSHVLRRGTRLDENIPGTGLGLSIVAEIVDLYGGVLSLDCSHQYGGLRVKLILPRLRNQNITS